MADDFVCPICLNVMIEPVTLPCSHGLCKACLENTLNEAAMQCPICRYRLSIWVRRNRKKGCLINQEKWNKIKELFSNYVEQKMSGNTSIELTEEEQKIIQPSPQKEFIPRPLAEPGELKREFDLEMARIREVEALEEQASIALARQLEMEEQERESVRQAMCKRDASMAAELQEHDTSTPQPKRARVDRPSWLDRFMEEKRRLDSGSPERQPVAPLSPVIKNAPKHDSPAWPVLRSRVLHAAGKENSPIASRVRRRAKAKLRKPVSRVPQTSLLDFAFRSPTDSKEERDRQFASQLQRRFASEKVSSSQTHDNAYLFRDRIAKKA